MTAVPRLLALIALLLMPFGMAAAPAVVAAQHHSPAAMATEHCPDQPSDADVDGGVSDCAMPCSAALPAVDLSPVDSLAVARPPADPALQTALSGIELEIATPPPKLS